MHSGTFTVDVANNRAYVRCTDNSSPDTHTMEVAAKSGDNYTFGINIYNKFYIMIEDIAVCNTTRSGIHISTLAGRNSSNITIQNCYVYNTGSAGIAITNWANNDGNHPITNCTIDNNTVSYTRQHGIFLGRDVRNTTISHNVVHHCGWGGIGASTGGHGISLWAPAETGDVAKPTNNIIEFNEVYNTYKAADGQEGHGIQCDDSSTSNIVRYNLVHDNEGTGLGNNSNGGNTFYYNISYSNGKYGARNHLHKSGKTVFYNNVLYDNVWGGFSQDDGSTATCIVKNNIIVENSTVEIRVENGGQTNFTSDYNCIHHSAGGNFMNWRGKNYDWTNWISNSGQDINSLNSNPLFVNATNNDFHLQANSPCIDVGVDVSLSQDYEGNPVPQGNGIDIGALEYQGNANPLSAEINATPTSNPLSAEINATPTSGYAPLSVNFTGSANGGKSPYTYSWDFGDGTTSSSQNPSHTYSSAGSYSVTLTVTDSNNSTTSDSLTITVSSTPSPLSVSASASTPSGEAPLTVNFTGSASGGTTPYSYSWDFGDGSTSTAQNPSHTYSSAGTYTVTLTVTDSTSETATDSLTITVTSPPSAEANLSITSLTGSPAPGSGGTTNPPPGNHSYGVGSSVQVKAEAKADYRFAKWSGDVSESDLYKTQITITMDKDKSIAAYFFTKCGDVNGDLSITPADAQAAFDIFLGKISNPTESELENADVNCDGTKAEPSVTPADAQVIFEKFLGKSNLPCSCSAASRASTLSGRIEEASNINLIISDIQAGEGEEIVVPIIVDDCFHLKSFGFDLIFTAESLEFVGVERGKNIEEFDKLDANLIAEGVVRAGGYKKIPSQEHKPQVLINLVFRMIGKTKKPISLTLVNTVDDIKNAPVIREKYIKETNGSSRVR